ncbi:hypothetical protein TL16_g05463 [Triparma laevis f. inornata]|uniref:Uncharacterized protein n=1 Tax=Triparma laevis f. inornata TaxID=1714386 RepID=A0A9W7AK96_9STRA|nr:hypothetical protein TL16_g05463 [Triparma laevis f. inornata]
MASYAGSSNPMHGETAGGQYTSFGITTTSSDHDKRVKMVMKVVVCAVCAEFVLFVMSAAFSGGVGFFDAVIVLLSLSVPYCGYRGAKKKDETSLMWFFGCNGFFAMLTFLMCILNWSMYKYLTQFCEKCKDEEFTIPPKECVDGGAEEAYKDYCVDGKLDTFKEACIGNTLLSIPLIILYGAGYYFGRELYVKADIIFVVNDGSGGAMHTVNQSTGAVSTMSLHGYGREMEMTPQLRGGGGRGGGGGGGAVVAGDLESNQI